MAKPEIVFCILLFLLTLAILIIAGLGWLKILEGAR